MTDRKMLELAVEAMGYRVHSWIADCFSVVRVESIEQNFDPFRWNPLTNPADTAEMCAALKLETLWTGDNVAVRIGRTSYHLPHDNTTQGKLAAWMRASTRAAAKVALNRRKSNHEPTRTI